MPKWPTAFLTCAMLGVLIGFGGVSPGLTGAVWTCIVVFTLMFACSITWQPKAAKARSR